MDFDIQQQHKSALSAPPEAATKRTSSGLDAVYDFFQGFMTGSGAQGGQLSAARVNLPWASALGGLGGSAPGTSPAGMPANMAADSVGPGGAAANSLHGGGSAAEWRRDVAQPVGQWPVEEPGERVSAPWVDGEFREEPMVSGLDPRWGLEVDDDAPRGSITPPLPASDARGGLTPQRSLTPLRGEGTPRSGEQAGLRNGRSHNPGVYEADQDDLLDQHVAYYLRHHPDVHAKHLLVRKRPGTYQIDDREVRVEWQYATEPGGQGFLVALDGPLRQPFSDYMEMSDNNAEWDSSIGRSSLSMIPKDKRMSFHDQHKVYTRLEAMKVAKEQALVREKHADYVKEGREAPGDLMHVYKKAIQQKLGQRQRHSHSHMGPPPEPSAYPGDQGNGPGGPRGPGGHGEPGGPRGPGGHGDSGGSRSQGGHGEQGGQHGPHGDHPGPHGHYPPPPDGGPPPGAYPPWSGMSRHSPGLGPPNLFGPPGFGPPPNYGSGPAYDNRWMYEPP